MVTGAAGFIGSHLCERLLKDGWRVFGVDCFTDYYSRQFKEQNLALLTPDPRFRFLEADLVTCSLKPMVQDVDVIFHQAGQAGVRASWGDEFRVYQENNILATQRLLEAAKGARLHRFVYASSSSIYGDVEDLPVSESALPSPISPYGVTKLAAEHLCHLYHVAYAIPTVSLRYFTVYGPRQRPDMAFYKLISAIAHHEAFPLYGDGQQTRDFTYVSDAVAANLLAVDGPVGWVFNIGGGARVKLAQVIDVIQDLVGHPARIERLNQQAGDVRHTWADTRAARDGLGFEPRVNLRDGLAEEISWFRKMRM
jgi:UDP-glucose 4-epimerase